MVGLPRFRTAPRLGLFVGGIALQIALCWLLAVDFTAAIATALLLSAAVTACFALLVSRPLLLGALLLCASALGVALYPPARGGFAVLGWGGTALISAFVWRHRRRAHWRLSHSTPPPGPGASG